MTGPQGWAVPDDSGALPATPPSATPPGAPQDAPAAPGWQGQSHQAQGWQGQSHQAQGWQGQADQAQGWQGQADQAQGWQGQSGWGGPGGPGGWGRPAPPELKPGVVPLRPLGLGELLDGAVTLVRRYPRPTLGLSAAIALVTTLLNVPLLLSLSDSPVFDPASFGPGSSVEFDAELGGLFAGLGATSLLSFLAGVVLAGIITAIVGKGVLGEPVSLGEAWRAVRPRLLRLLGLAVVVLLIVSATFVAGVVLFGITVAVAGGLGALVGVPLLLASMLASAYLYVRLSLAPSVMVLEKAGLRESLRRSGVLVKGDWWRVFGILLLVFVITGFISQVLQTPFAVRSFSAGLSGEATTFGPTDVALQSIGSALALTVVGPFGAAVTALLYVDRRMRAEGLDVSLAAAASRSA